MELAKEKKPLFPVFYDISRDALEEASESLEKKARNVLMNFINACCQGKVDEANTFKRIYDDCESHLNFIETIMEKME
jgi:bacterioferritin (cytochrome b1)